MLGGYPAAPFIIEDDTVKSIVTNLVQTAVDQYDCWQVCDDTDQFFLSQA
jgi:hypothetical protein